MFLNAIASSVASASRRRVTPPPPPSGGSGSTTFDSYYTGWAGYTEMASTGTTTRSYSLPAKPAKGNGFGTAQLTDPISGMRMYRLTDFNADGYGIRARHLYSRRTPTNADDSKVLMLGGSGFYYVLDLPTFTKDVQGGAGGSLPSFAQDTEPFWHPTDPNVIWRGDQNGTLNYYSYNIETGVTTSLFTLSGKLPSGFESATRAWTRDEGRPSRDGRYWCLQMETPAFGMVGIVCYDRVADQVIGHILTTNRPNHCSMSPLGNYMVVSFEDATGTRAYPRDYVGAESGGTLLLGGSEHSDIAVGPDGTTEWFVCADYSARGGTATYFIYARKLSDGTRIDLIPMYPVPGEDYGVHISGNASIDKPGWVLLSTYSSGENYNAVRPAANARLHYETVFWCQIQASPTLKIVSEHHARPYDPPPADDDDEYFNEPQASPNKDGTKIFFCSNWIGRSGTTTNTQPDLYMIGAPSDWDTR